MRGKQLFRSYPLYSFNQDYIVFNLGIDHIKVRFSNMEYLIDVFHFELVQSDIAHLNQLKCTSRTSVH